MDHCRAQQPDQGRQPNKLLRTAVQRRNLPLLATVFFPFGGMDAEGPRVILASSVLQKWSKSKQNPNKSRGLLWFAICKLVIVPPSSSRIEQMPTHLRMVKEILADADANTWDTQGRRPLHDLCEMAGACRLAKRRNSRREVLE